jgi:hypothetical protein
MYQDRDSIEIFRRMHERDRVRDMARHIGEQSSGDTDLFAVHARAEARDGRMGVTLSFALVAVMTAALFGVLAAVLE